MTQAVGKDLFAMCGKCDAEWHVVVAMDAGRVTKVQCKQCMGYHRYRAPPGEVDVNKGKGRRHVAATRSRSNGNSKPVSSAVIQPDMARPVRNYTMRESYEPGDRIDHPKFGRGVVESSSAGKMMVFFETEGRRTLAQGR
jgi:hypothetical protein